LPPRAIDEALATARRPSAAHQILGNMRRVAPLGDRRLLVGLQMLVATGALKAS
jgi:hypothetical protein